MAKKLVKLMRKGNLMKLFIILSIKYPKTTGIISMGWKCVQLVLFSD